MQTHTHTCSRYTRMQTALHTHAQTDTRALWMLRVSFCCSCQEKGGEMMETSGSRYIFCCLSFSFLYPHRQNKISILLMVCILLVYWITLIYFSLDPSLLLFFLLIIMYFTPLPSLWGSPSPFVLDICPVPPHMLYSLEEGFL